MPLCNLPSCALLLRISDAPLLNSVLKNSVNLNSELWIYHLGSSYKFSLLNPSTQIRQSFSLVYIFFLCDYHTMSQLMKRCFVPSNLYVKCFSDTNSSLNSEISHLIWAIILSVSYSSLHLFQNTAEFSLTSFRVFPSTSLAIFSVSLWTHFLLNWLKSLIPTGKSLF